MNVSLDNSFIFCPLLAKQSGQSTQTSAAEEDSTSESASTNQQTSSTATQQTPTENGTVVNGDASESSENVPQEVPMESDEVAMKNEESAEEVGLFFSIFHVGNS